MKAWVLTGIIVLIGLLCIVPASAGTAYATDGYYFQNQWGSGETWDNAHHDTTSSNIISTPSGWMQCGAYTYGTTKVEYIHRLVQKFHVGEEYAGYTLTGCKLHWRSGATVLYNTLKPGTQTIEFVEWEYNEVASNFDISNMGAHLGSQALSTATYTWYETDITGATVDSNGDVVIAWLIGSDYFDSTSGWVWLDNKNDRMGTYWYTSTDYKSHLDYSSAAPPVYANIIGSPASGIWPLVVTFTDDSEGFNTSATYNLDFNDTYTSSGNWSSGAYWIHTYYSPGTYVVKYNVTYSGTLYQDTVTINVTEGTNNFEVIVAGVNGAPISGADVDISYNGESDSDTTDANGEVYFTVPTNTYVSGTVSKTGYQDANFGQYVYTWDTWTNVRLYTTNQTPGIGDEGYGTVVYLFKNGITGATVSETPVFVSIYTDSDKTDLYSMEYTYSGTYDALIPMNETMYVTVEAAVYHTIEFTTSISESPTYITKNLMPQNPGSDVDNDGIPDMWDDDIDNDGIPNSADTDDDNDNIPDDDDETPEGGLPTLSPVLRIWVMNTANSPIVGATVSVSSGIDSGIHTTNSSGAATHYCANLVSGQSRVYDVEVSSGGYTGQSGQVTVSTQSPTVTFYLATYSAPTAEPTSYTPPDMPVWSGDNGTPGNLQEYIFNWTIGELGISFTASGMLLGLIICIVCAAVVGGASNSGMGAMIGGGFGWLAAGVMGYIPAWAIIVSVALVVMAFFIMRGSGNED